MNVAALFRFPVKSMGGERLDRVTMTERGLDGDRRFAVVDRSDGRVVSGKHPRKWGRILELAADYPAGPSGPVRVTFPDGSEATSDDDRLDPLLSRFLGADVTLAEDAPAGVAVEEVWPADVDGLAPMELVESMGGARREGADLVTDIPLASMAPPGRFFDLTTLHVLTEATLAELRRLESASDFDVRRYRPNVLVDDAGAGFVENDWVGGTLALGTAARARVDLPTMRCVLTTMAQPGLPADRRSLQTIARSNRVEIPGMGTWACAGVYASITSPGEVAVGDAVALHR